MNRERILLEVLNEHGDFENVRQQFDENDLAVITESMLRFAKLGQTFDLGDASGSLPNNFKQLPEKLQSKLVRKHTHAELVDGEKIVYEEQDVLDIIKYVSGGNYL